jgi:hypothetical protein
VSESVTASDAEQKKVETNEFGGILYVIFHGEIVFRDDAANNEICVLTPKMSDHVFEAGPWLGERNIPEGSDIRLRGVLRTGTDKIRNHPDRFLIFNSSTGSQKKPMGKAPMDKAMGGSHFTIHMPRPVAILPGFTVEVSPDVVTSAHLVKVPPAVDVRPVFMYLIKPGGNPRLKDTRNGREWRAGAGPTLFQSLHVVAAHDGIATPPHEVMAFKMATALLGITDAVLKADEPVGAMTPGVIPGLAPSETQMRPTDWIDTLTNLGVQLRSDPPGSPLTWMPQSTEIPAATTTATCFGPGNCGPIGD